MIMFGLSWLLYDAQGFSIGIVFGGTVVVSSLGMRALQHRRRRDAPGSEQS